MPRIFLLFPFLFFLSCQPAVVGPSSVCDNPGGFSAGYPKAQQFQTLLDKYTKLGLPGIALLVRDADGRWVGSSGMADIDKGIPFEPCHVSKLASVTKVFMGALVMKLVEQGVFELDDPVSKWLSAGLRSPLFQYQPPAGCDDH